MAFSLSLSLMFEFMFDLSLPICIKAMQYLYDFCMYQRQRDFHFTFSTIKMCSLPSDALHLLLINNLLDTQVQYKHL